MDRVREQRRSVHGQFSRFATGDPSTYKSPVRRDLPARVYSARLARAASRALSRIRSIEAILRTRKAKSVPRGGACLEGPSRQLNRCGGTEWPNVACAIVYATWQFMQRDAKVTELIWTNIDQD